MTRTKKIIATVLFIAVAIFAGWKLFESRKSKDIAGERSAQPVLAVYDRKGELKATDFSKSKHVFVSWNNDKATDMAEQLDPFFKGNQPILVTLEIWPLFNNRFFRNNVVEAIVAGRYDQKLIKLCNYLSKQSQQVLIRFAPEMEVYVDVYPWQKQSSTVYIDAFRHVAGLCRKNVPTAKIVWAPAGYPGTEEFWPGSAWVDIISVTLQGKSELIADRYPKPASMATLIKRKILRTRFFDKPVLVIGSEEVTVTTFQRQSFDTAVQEIMQNQALLYNNVAAAEQKKDASLFRKEGELIVGAYDPNTKIVTNPLIKAEHLFVNLGELKSGSFKKVFDSVIARNHDVIVTMEPWKAKGLEKDPELINNILNGHYDSVFTELFSIISSTKKTVYLRWLHEMEIPITRYPWQSQDPIDYIKAFRYFVNKLQPKPANVFIVWGPAGDRGSLEFWPGSDVVDYLSIAIYGLPDKNITDHNKQESFSTIFNRKYGRLRFVHKPLFITEFGVKGPQDYKKKWLQEAAKTINEHPEIIGINYFNDADSPKAWGDIETPDWSTSPEVFNGFLKQLNIGSIK